MTNSKFDYVQLFEEKVQCLKNTFIVIRLDGCRFNKFTSIHSFQKPNDINGLNLMNKAALEVCKEFEEIFLAYGCSDEYSFAFRRNSNLFKRRREKILSSVLSYFSSAYVYHWKEYMDDKPLNIIPHFDGRLVLYPTLENLQDYFSCRQVNCHINNLYNTCFWMLVNRCGNSEKQAEQILNGTVSSDKHEILFSKCNINYNNELQIFKKGSVIIRSDAKDNKQQIKGKPFVHHIDCITPSFWEAYKTA